MAKRKEEKTNVMRTLEQKRIPYTGYTYPHEEGVAVDGETVAALLGLDAATVYKTLVTRGASGGYYVFDIPVGATLDLKKAARAAGEKSIAMLPSRELLGLTPEQLAGETARPGDRTAAYYASRPCERCIAFCARLAADLEAGTPAH